MEIDQMMRDAYVFTRTALADHPARWIALTLLGLVPVLNLVVVGYLARVFGDASDPPDLDDPAHLLIDGLRLVAVSIVYLFVIGCIMLLLAGGAILVAGGMSFIEDPVEDFGVFGLMLGFMAIGVFYIVVAIASIVVVVVTLVYFLALVRAARTRSIGQAFAIREIVLQIRGIGWLNYLSALLVLNFALTLLVYLVVGFGLITLGIGLVLVLPLLPALGVYTVKYLSLINDSSLASPGSFGYSVDGENVGYGSHGINTL